MTNATLIGNRDMGMSRVGIFVTMLILAAAAAGSAGAATIYVSGSVETSGDGTSWETAKKTIQEGIDAAAKNDTVLIANGTYSISTALTIAGDSKDIELKGATGDPNDVTIDAQDLCPCLVSSDANQNIISSLTFVNGYSTEKDVAGGITVTGRSLITNCVVRACYHGLVGQDVNGGGIYASCGDLTPAYEWPSARQYVPAIVDTLVEGCAVYLDGSTTKIYARGGGVYSVYHNSSNLTVRDCVATNYTTKNDFSYPSQGGGAWFQYGSHQGDKFLRCTLENRLESAGFLSMGAGVYLAGKSASICGLSDSLIEGNRARGCGAGVGMAANSRLSGCTVRGNRIEHVTISSQYQLGGAGIYVDGDNAVIENALVEGNSAVTNGPNITVFSGAVNVNNSDNVIIRDSVIRDNFMERSGALNLISTGNLLVTNCVMCGNVASGEVSAVRFLTNQTKVEDCVEALISDCYIVSNSNPRVAALSGGGGVLQYGGAFANKSGFYGAPLKVRNCLFAGNSASNGSTGWGVRATLGAKGSGAACQDILVMDHCTFANNMNFTKYKNFVAFGSEAMAQHARFSGCVFRDNCYSGSSSSRAYVQTDYPGAATFEHCYADVTNVAFVVTAENGNLGPDAGDVGFVDPANLDYRLQQNSCLVDRGGAHEEWMGNGRKTSVQDLGSGYEVEAVGVYGVAVVRKNTNPRYSGAASDIGCCESYTPKGLVISIH